MAVDSKGISGNEESVIELAEVRKPGIDKKMQQFAKMSEEEIERKRNQVSINDDIFKELNVDAKK